MKKNNQRKKTGRKDRTCLQHANACQALKRFLQQDECLRQSSQQAESADIHWKTSVGQKLFFLQMLYTGSYSQQCIARVLACKPEMPHRSKKFNASLSASKHRWKRCFQCFENNFSALSGAQAYDSRAERYQFQAFLRGNLRCGVLGALLSMAADRRCAAWISGAISWASGRLCQYLRGISLRMAATLRRAGLKMCA